MLWEKLKHTNTRDNENMESNKLPKHFFEQNELEELSTAVLTHFRMITQGMPELNEQAAETVSDK